MKKPIHIMVEEEEIKLIDGYRGKVSRAAWIRQAIEMRLASPARRALPSKAAVAVNAHTTKD